MWKKKKKKKINFVCSLEVLDQLWWCSLVLWRFSVLLWCLSVVFSFHGWRYSLWCLVVFRWNLAIIGGFLGFRRLLWCLMVAFVFSGRYCGVYRWFFVLRRPFVTGSALFRPIQHLFSRFSIFFGWFSAFLSGSTCFLTSSEHILTSSVAFFLIQSIFWPVQSIFRPVYTPAKAHSKLSITLLREHTTEKFPHTILNLLFHLPIPINKILPEAPLDPK